MKIKKVLKFSIIFFLAGMAAFFMLGVVRSSVTGTTQITVNAPVEQCWKLLNDTSLIQQWLPSVKSINKIEGEENAYQLILVRGEKEIQVTEKVIVLNKNEKLVLMMDSEIFTSNIAITLQAKGNTTTIDIKQKIVAKSMMLRSIFALSSGSIQKDVEETYLRLKDVIEKN